MSISMSANVALACIFLPKIWIILFEKQQNSHKQGDAFTKRLFVYVYFRFRKFKQSIGKKRMRIIAVEILRIEGPKNNA